MANVVGTDASSLIQEPLPSAATAEVDADNLGTGPQGTPLRRERVRVVQDSGTRMALELQGIALMDVGTMAMVSRSSRERISQTDRRGSAGRGTTR